MSGLSSARLGVYFSVLFVAYAVSTYCRRLLYVFSKEVSSEIGFTNEQFGVLVSTQAFCFTISKTTFAFLCDRISAVRLMLIGLCGVGIATIALSAVDSYSALLATVVLNGLGQGAGWTPSVTLIRKWSPAPLFGSLYSLFGVSNTISGMLLPYTAYYYWRSAVLVAGGFCLLESAVSLYILWDESVAPEHVNVEVKRSEGSSSMQIVLSSMPVWHSGLLYAVPIAVRTICETWIPQQLSAKGFDAGSFLFFLEVGGLIGTLVSGSIMDSMASKSGIPTATRRATYGSTVCLMLILAAACNFIEQLPGLFGFFCGAAYLGAINVFGLSNARIAPVHMQGAASAVLALLSNCGSVAAGAPLSLLLGPTGLPSLTPLFLTVAVMVTVTYTFQLEMQMEEVKEVENKKER